MKKIILFAFICINAFGNDTSEFMETFKEKTPQFKVLKIDKASYVIDMHKLMHKTLNIESGSGTIDVSKNHVAVGPAQINVSQIDTVLKNKTIVKNMENVFDVKITKETIKTDHRANILAGYIIYLSKMRDVPHWVRIIQKDGHPTDFSVWKSLYNGTKKDGNKTTAQLYHTWKIKNGVELI